MTMITIALRYAHIMHTQHEADRFGYLHFGLLVGAGFFKTGFDLHDVEYFRLVVFAGE